MGLSRFQRDLPGRRSVNLKRWVATTRVLAAAVKSTNGVMVSKFYELVLWSFADDTIIVISHLTLLLRL